MLKTTHQVDSFYFTRGKGSSGVFTAWGGIQIYPTSRLWSSLARAGTRGQSVILCDLSWVNMCALGNLKDFCCSVCLQITTKVPLVLILELQINFIKQVNLQMLNPRIMNQFYPGVKLLVLEMYVCLTSQGNGVADHLATHRSSDSTTFTTSLPLLGIVAFNLLI